eukprot:PhM_4_TR14601/c0_g1_i1/m.31512
MTSQFSPVPSSSSSVCTRAFYKHGYMWSAPQTMYVPLDPTTNAPVSDDILTQLARDVFSIPASVELVVQIDNIGTKNVIAPGCTIVFSALGFDFQKPDADDEDVDASARPKRTQAAPPPQAPDMSGVGGNSSSSSPVGSLARALRSQSRATEVASYQQQRRQQQTPPPEVPTVQDIPVGFLTLGLDIFSTLSALGSQHNAKLMQMVMSSAFNTPNVTEARTYDSLASLHALRDIALEERSKWVEGVKGLVPSPGPDVAECATLDALLDTSLQALVEGSWKRPAAIQGAAPTVAPRVMLHGPAGTGKTMLLRRLLRNLLVPSALASYTYATTFFLVLDWSKLDSGDDDDALAETISTTKRRWAQVYSTFISRLLRCISVQRPYFSTRATSDVVYRFLHDLIHLSDGLPELSPQFCELFPVLSLYLRLQGMQIQSAFHAGSIDEFLLHTSHLVNVVCDTFSFTTVTLLVDNMQNVESRVFKGLLEPLLASGREYACVLATSMPEVVSSATAQSLLCLPMERFFTERDATKLTAALEGSKMHHDELKERFPRDSLRCPGHAARALAAANC